MSRRTYGQDCALACGLDLVGERWTLLLVRELLLGPQRFSDLLESLAGIGTNLLSARLQRMERDGLVTKRRLPPPAASTVYTLTERGQALEGVVLEIARWGRPLLPPEPERMRPGWLLLALKAAFDPKGAGDLDASYELSVEEETFDVRIKDGRIDVVRGSNPRADVAITSDTATLLKLASGTLEPRAAMADGRIALAGDRTAGRRWFQAFSVVRAQ